MSLPMSPPWQWVSFAGDEGFRGIAIVRAHDVAEAALIAMLLGINPGGEVLALEVPPEYGPPPAEWDHKLITDKERINDLTNKWHGCDAVRLGDVDSEGEG